MSESSEAPVTTNNRIKGIGPDVTSGGDVDIAYSEPYRVEVVLKGDSDIIFHRWNVEAVAEKAKASKGSKAKKTDNVESYVYRNDEEEICIPGEYLRQSIINAAKYKQDPRSPRKSARDLVEAAVQSLTPLSTLGIKTWDYEHACRVQVQRAGITRVRPAIRLGWTASFILMVTLPEYVSTEMLNHLIVNAGRLVGLADFRPTYGRFQIVKFDELK